MRSVINKSASVQFHPQLKSMFSTKTSVRGGESEKVTDISGGARRDKEEKVRAVCNEKELTSLFLNDVFWLQTLPVLPSVWQNFPSCSNSPTLSLLFLSLSHWWAWISSSSSEMETSSGELCYYVSSVTGFILFHQTVSAFFRFMCKQA